ncbi:MAG TPA: pilus assembly protein TadG-related protein [Candidatus Limnocylindria bacterium]|nr:pilus assembly protein TadG-related protein [Candidatus Limnocylindria bacterium]
MNWFIKRKRSSEEGQILVIVGVGLLAMIAMVGLVVDGGYAWGQQRQTQNGADAMANAGATVIAQNLKGAPKTGGDVGCAVEASATLNSISNPRAIYTDVTGTTLGVDVPACAAGAGDAIPSTAQGVKATGDKTFNTFLARVIGVDEMTATSEATAVAGILTGTCPASAGCGLLPVTFPLTLTACDGTNQQVQIGSSQYPIVSLDDADSTNEVIVPICSSGPGAVGWLDFGCGNLSSTITNPCDVSFPLPTWLHTEPGNTNSLDDDINGLFAGPVLGVADDSQVTIPINDNTCNTDPGDNQPTCPGGNGSGNGNNFYYHIPKVASFMLDRVYTSGGNSAECNELPGAPFIGGNGATGCFKGWFIQYSTQGPVGAGATGPNDPGIIGIQLIH